MSQQEIRFTFNRHNDHTSLSGADSSLLDLAREACGFAYAPYSDFKVGVAIRTTENIVVTGSNQENGAYPIGQCAERVGLYRLIHEQGRKKIDTIAIVVDHDQQQQPASPCGSCRQLLTEYRSYQQSSIRLLLTSASGNEVLEIADVTDLLPLAFDGKFLGQ